MSQQTFKVGDRVSVIALNNGPYLGKTLAGTIVEIRREQYYIEADDKKYANYALVRRVTEITPLVVGPTDAELAATLRAGRVAQFELEKRGYNFKTVSSAGNMLPVAWKTYSPDIEIFKTETKQVKI